MMNTLVDMMKNFEKYKKYIENINLNNSPVMITGLTFASKSFFLVSTIASIIEQNKDKKKNIYYSIVENEIDIYKIREDIEYSPIFSATSSLLYPSIFNFFIISF